jgi:DNA-binding PadR family transcriptional regulator
MEVTMPEPLTPAVFHILLALADQERHGYGIMQDVLERTDKQIKLGPGTLYGTIKRLLETNHIEELPEREDENQQRRRYYKLTSAGRKTLKAEAERLEHLVNIARSKRLLPQLKGVR